MFQQFVWCEVVRAIILPGDWLFGLSALLGRMLDSMFIVRRVTLLDDWLFVEVGLGSVFTPTL